MEIQSFQNLIKGNPLCPIHFVVLRVSQGYKNFQISINGENEVTYVTEILLTTFALKLPLILSGINSKITCGSGNPARQAMHFLFVRQIFLQR